MSRLIIVAGAGGAGKSFFLRLWAKHDDNARPIKKFVSESRKPREIEIRTGESDLIFSRCYDPSTSEGANWYQEHYPSLMQKKGLIFHDKTYSFSSLNNPSVYNYHGTYYEVDMQSIQNALDLGKNPIVIVRKCETIKNLLNIYKDALVIYVQSILSGNDLVQKLVDLGESEDDARKRESRNAEDLKDYISSIQQLPSGVRVVINDFNEDDSGAVLTQIRDIYTEEILNYRFIEKSVFVIQSYLKSDRAKNTFESICHAAVEAFGRTHANVYRADLRQDGAYLIPDHVWNSLSTSDYIVCDITGDRCEGCEKITTTSKHGAVPTRNYQGVSANVWLELGYAISQIRERGLSIEDRLILIEQRSDNSSRTMVPIDLGGTATRVLSYSDAFDLMLKLTDSFKNISDGVKK